jgi:hypothetical protein
MQVRKRNFSGNSFQILCSGGIVGQKKVNKYKNYSHPFSCSWRRAVWLLSVVMIPMYD